MTPEPSNAPPARVLVVDDDPSTRRLFQIMLEADGFDCEGAGDAAEALAALDGGGFDLVLCDLLLGDEDGMGLARQILDLEDGASVIMITGIDDPALSDAAMESGASGYLVKPVRRSEFLLSVTNALRRRAVEREVREFAGLLAKIDQLLASSAREGTSDADVVASLRRLRASG